MLEEEMRSDGWKKGQQPEKERSFKGHGQTGSNWVGSDKKHRKSETFDGQSKNDLLVLDV